MHTIALEAAIFALSEAAEEFIKSLIEGETAKCTLWRQAGNRL